MSEFNAATGAAIKPSFITGLNFPVALAVSGNTLFVVNNGTGTGSTVGEYIASTGAAIDASLITGLGTPGGLAVSTQATSTPVAKDFNGDGNADLVWENTATGQRGIWLLNNGVFSSTITLPTVGAPWRIAGAGDFDGDGYADLVWEDTVTGYRGIWFMKNGVYSSSTFLPTEPLTWDIVNH